MNELSLFGSDEPRKKRAPRNLADECIGWWKAAFPSNVRDARGEPVHYRMGGGDGKAVQDLIRDLEPHGLTLEKFQRNALALMRTRDRFWSTNRTLRVLCSRWSDIAALEVLETAAPKRSHLGQPPTFKPDPSFSDELRRQAREAEERFRRMRPR